MEFNPPGGWIDHRRRKKHELGGPPSVADLPDRMALRDTAEKGEIKRQKSCSAGTMTGRDFGNSARCERFYIEFRSCPAEERLFCPLEYLLLELLWRGAFLLDIPLNG
ncbi:MAG: hypothetical protein V1736_11610 [Pseudomonadota bacterium]